MTRRHEKVHVKSEEEGEEREEREGESMWWRGGETEKQREEGGNPHSRNQPIP